MASFCQKAYPAKAAAKPGEGSFDCPPARENREALGSVGSLDDLKGFRRRSLEASRACCPHSRRNEDVEQPENVVADRCQHSRYSVAILHVRSMFEHEERQSERVGHDVELAALDLFPASQPASPPLSLVFTLWLSMAPAVRLASRASGSRVLRTKTWLIIS